METRARFRDQLFARSSLRARASGVVLQAAGRHDQVRRESAEEIRGHLSAELPLRRLAGTLGGDERASSFSGPEHGVRIFRVDNPHTKPVAFWEYLISGVRAKFPDAIFLSRSVHAPEDDEGAGQGGLYAELHLFHLAQFRSRSSPNTSPSSRRRDARILSRQSLAEHAGHSAVHPAARRAPDVS